MNEQKTLIYIIDDDSAVLEALSSLVRSIGLSVACFSSATDFLNNLDENTQGCLILDVRMPEMSGMDVQRKMLDIAEHIPIIFISGHGDIPMAVKAIKAGAIDFLTKPFREEDLLCAIRTAINMIPKKEVTVAEIKDRYDSLSKREKEVIRFVLKGFLNKQTALELGISEATVKVHRHNIMRKMKTSSVQDLVRVCDRIESFYFDDCDNN